jgi:hypothetical protein
MTTTLPSQPPIFTPEQRRLLGQVYNLILSWRNEKKNHVPSPFEGMKSQSEETIQPNCSQCGEADV